LQDELIRAIRTWFIPCLAKVQHWDESLVNQVEEKLAVVFSESSESLDEIWLSAELADVLRTTLSESMNVSFFYYVLKRMEDALHRANINWFTALQANEHEQLYGLPLMYQSLEQLPFRDAERIIHFACLQQADDEVQQFVFIQWLLDAYPSSNDTIHPLLTRCIHEYFASLLQNHDWSSFSEAIRVFLNKQKHTFISREVLSFARGQQGLEVFRFWVNQLRSLDSQYLETQTVPFIYSYLEEQQTFLHADDYLQEVCYCLERFLDRLPPDQRTKSYIQQVESRLSLATVTEFDMHLLREIHAYKQTHRLPSKNDRIKPLLFWRIVKDTTIFDEATLLQAIHDLHELELDVFAADEWQSIVAGLCETIIPVMTQQSTVRLFQQFMKTKYILELYQSCLRIAEIHWLTHEQTAHLIAMFEDFAIIRAQSEDDHEWCKIAENQWYIMLKATDSQRVQVLANDMKQTSKEVQGVWQVMVEKVSWEQRHPLLSRIKKWIGS
jgi:hypothetical protein